MTAFATAPGCSLLLVAVLLAFQGVAPGGAAPAAPEHPAFGGSEGPGAAPSLAAPPGLSHPSGPPSASHRVDVSPSPIPVARFAVSQTVEVTNGTVLPGNVPGTPNGAEPWSIDYDSTTSMLLVASVTSAQLDVVSPTTGTIVASVDIGGMPGSVVYDPLQNEAFVGDLNTDNLTVVSMANDTIVGRIQVGASPWDLLFDPSTDQVFAGCANGIGVSVVNASTNTVAATVVISGADGGLAYVPSLGEVFVGDQFSTQVYVFSVATDAVVHQFRLPTATTDLWYDNTTGQVLALTGNGTQGFVTEIAPGNDTIVGTVPVGAAPDAVVSDPRTGDVFVSNYNSNNLTVIAGLNGTSPPTETSVGVAFAPTVMVEDPAIPAVEVLLPWLDEVVGVSTVTGAVLSSAIIGVAATGIAVDPVSGQLFVGDYDSNRVSVLSGTNYSLERQLQDGLRPTAFAYDSGRGEMVVMNGGDPYVTFVNASTDAEVWNATTEFGMTSIAYDAGRGEVLFTTNFLDWISGISDTTYAQTFTQGTAIDPTAVAYDPAMGELFVAQAGSDQVMILNDTNDSVVGTVNVGGGPIAMAYDPATHEMFVVNLGGWDVSVISDATDRVVATVRVGGYPNGIAYDANASAMLVANSLTNNVSVISDRTDQVTSSFLVGLSPQSVAYAPAQGRAYVANQASGTVSVLTQNLTPVAVNLSVSTSPSSCARLTFNGSAIPSGAVVSLFPGNYNATVGHCPGYLFEGWEGSGSIRITTPGAMNATVAVSGDGSIVAVFALPPPPRYAVTFAETGLPPSTFWEVALNGSTQSGTSSSLWFNVPNGTYPFGITTYSAYVPNPTSGTILVTGANTSRNVLFELRPPPLVANFSWRIDSASCLTNGTVQNLVTVTAAASGGTPPYTFDWITPTGSASGPTTNTTLTLGENDSVTLTVRDSSGGQAVHTAKVPLSVPPCPPPPPPPTVPVVSTASPSYVDIGLAAGGVAVVLAAAVIAVAVYRRRRGPGSDPLAPP